jgi:hypothetical protein
MMNSYKKIPVLFLISMSLPCLSFAQEDVDTSYNYNATPVIYNLIKPGKAPVVTIQLSGYYNIGLMGLSGEDNTYFNLSDFRHGRNFGTRHGFGFSLTGKLALHKAGYIRLIAGFLFNRFQSNFIASSPDGKISYSVFSPMIGLEDCFTPDRPFKPYVSLEILPSIINGHANFDTTNILTPNVPVNVDLKIRNSFRLGFAVNMGFEYAFGDYVGVNLGVKLTNANVIGKEAKVSTDTKEIYLNDDYVYPVIPYSGWKQFFFTTFYTGLNFYFGMKNKK